MKIIIFSFMMAILSLSVYSATIHGTIYEFSLDKAIDVKVEIDTQPKQVYISKNGTYSFNVPNGDYEVSAEQSIGTLLKASISENITVKDTGTYVLDLILFPIIDEEEFEDDLNIIDPYADEKSYNSILIFLIIILVLILIIYYKNKDKLFPNKNTKISDNELENLIKVIKQEGGRTTQKEIRKQIPLSEGKISLMVTELEHKGVIEKIKKGRGNIIILKKK